MSDGTQKKPLWKNKWFWIGTIIVLVILSQIGGNTTSPEAAAEATFPTAEIVVSPQVYYDDYDGNEVAADAKYKGKVIELTGEVEDVSKSLGSVYVNIKVPSDPTGLLGIRCELENESDAATISKGSIITLVGEGSGKLMFPRLSDCVIK